MTHNIDIGILSLATGAVVAVQDVPGIEIADRVGVAGIAVMVVWWMLTGFSKRLDSLTAAIEHLTQQFNDK